MYYFSIFSKRLTKHALIFCAFGWKAQLIGHLEKIFERFQKISKNFSRKFPKCIIVAYFSKYLTKNELILARLDEKRKLVGNFEKIFDKNLIEKLNFYFVFILIMEILLLKIEPSEITPFFYNNFSVSGKGISPFPPGYALSASSARGNFLVGNNVLPMEGF